MSVVEEVRDVLARIEAMGATVVRGKPSGDAEIAAAEAALGFALPDEYKEFLRELGSIEIELVRTWLFYGLPERPKLKALYVDEFAQAGDEGGGDEGDDGPYVPKRFVVLADEGEFCNAAEGFVWDGDLGHIRATAGGDYIEKSEFLEEGYWAFLSDQLEEIHDRIADPKDVLVGGSEDAVNARRKLPG